MKHWLIINNSVKGLDEQRIIESVKFEWPLFVFFCFFDILLISVYLFLSYYFCYIIWYFWMIIPDYGPWDRLQTVLSIISIFNFIVMGVKISYTLFSILLSINYFIDLVKTKNILYVYVFVWWVFRFILFELVDLISIMFIIHFWLYIIFYIPSSEFFMTYPFKKK